MLVPRSGTSGRGVVTIGLQSNGAKSWMWDPDSSTVPPADIQTTRDGIVILGGYSFFPKTTIFWWQKILSNLSEALKAFLVHL